MGVRGGIGEGDVRPWDPVEIFYVLAALFGVALVVFWIVQIVWFAVVFFEEVRAEEVIVTPKAEELS